MRHTMMFALFSLLVLPATLWADDQVTAIPLPAPRLSESTLITGTGWSDSGNRNESLACHLAESRAIQQVKRGIALARSKGLLTTDELSRALPARRFQQWDRAAGRCIVRMELEIPSTPKSGIPIINGRQF